VSVSGLIEHRPFQQRNDEQKERYHRVRGDEVHRQMLTHIGHRHTASLLAQGYWDCDKGNCHHTYEYPFKDENAPIHPGDEGDQMRDYLCALFLRYHRLAPAGIGAPLLAVAGLFFGFKSETPSE
jgi:hypothetical protein